MDSAPIAEGKAPAPEGGPPPPAPLGSLEKTLEEGLDSRLSLRQRVWHGLGLEGGEKGERATQPANWPLPLALACVILGAMVGLQYRTQAGDVPVHLDDRRKTLELVRTLEGERNRMSSEISELRARLADLEQASAQVGTVGKQLQEQLARSRAEAGLTGIQGRAS